MSLSSQGYLHRYRLPGLSDVVYFQFMFYHNLAKCPGVTARLHPTLRLSYTRESVATVFFMSLEALKVQPGCRRIIVNKINHKYRCLARYSHALRVTLSEGFIVKNTIALCGRWSPR
jgi:hypothetical protein